jgi:DNA-binding transcriptional regulator YiaG
VYHRNMKTPLRPPPSPEEFIAARNAAGHSQTEAGAVLGVTLRGVQGWESHPDKKGARQCPAAVFTLYLLLTGQHPTHWLELLDADQAP